MPTTTTTAPPILARLAAAQKAAARAALAGAPDAGALNEVYRRLYARYRRSAHYREALRRLERAREGRP